jgi:hypothetical protein
MRYLQIKESLGYVDVLVAVRLKGNVDDGVTQTAGVFEAPPEMVVVEKGALPGTCDPMLLKSCINVMRNESKTCRSFLIMICKM